MTNLFFQRDRASLSFLVICVFILLVFLTGGGSRADIQSLIFLRPLSVLVCTYGLWGLTWHHIRQYAFTFSFAAALFVLVGLHLVPLPPIIWELLPGRELISEIDRTASLGDVWRPISMIPSGTWNALFSLFVPLAVLIVGAQLSREQRFQLLPFLISCGVVSGIIGLLQTISAPDSLLYLYEVTNYGTAVGLFANRNHQAMLLGCLFPLLAIYALPTIGNTFQTQMRLWTSIAIGIFIVPLILVTGSRGGLFLGIIGIMVIPFLYYSPKRNDTKSRKTLSRYLKLAVFGILILSLVLLTIIFSRAEAFDRLVALDKIDEDRLQIWPVIAKISWKYFPVGSGVGSFVEIYQIDEPLALATTEYTNHAHNDWLEIYMTSGLLGLALAASAIAGWFRTSFAAWKFPRARTREISFARLGSIIILIIALGSIGDYPSRVPSIMCLIVVAALWLEGGVKNAQRQAWSEAETKSYGSLADTPLSR